MDLDLDLHLDLDLDLNLGQWLSRPVWCKFQCGKEDILVMGPGSGPGSGFESGPVAVQTRLVRISMWKRRYSANES